MRRRLLSFVAMALSLSFAAVAQAQQIGVDTTQNMGMALAFSVEPTVHFVNTMEAGSSTATLVGDGLGLGASARGMLFPMARPDGALGFGLQAGLGYSQLFSAGSGLIVAAGGLRYVLGAQRTAYWVDVNAGAGLSSNSAIGGAPYVDVGIGWQFASAPTFMWGIAGRWSFFFPDEAYTDATTVYDDSRNYSFLSLALILEWGPPRWQEVQQVTPIPLAQGPMPVQQQPGQVPMYQTQPGYQVQPGPGTQPGPGPGPVQPQPVAPNPNPGPGPVQPIPVSNPGPVNFSNTTPNDQDGDGIGDEADQCPAYAEDQNGRADNDGCPDADRDADGVPDVLDQCPGRPEDFDGTRDEDGCPD
jgi:hypothetical protein